MLRLETFGGLALTNGQAERPQPRRRLALLARLSLPGAHGVTRDELFALFWPESDIESARHCLDQLLYETRRSLAASPIRGTAALMLDPEIISSDMADWSAALERDDLAAAAALYRGPFLHGFYLNGSSEFERWAQSARAQVSADYRRALETLATRAGNAGCHQQAVQWWRKLAAEDHFGAHTALGLMRALVDAGDRPGALEFARIHEGLIRAEFDCPPDPAVFAFAEALRTDAGAGSMPRVPITIPVSSASDVADCLPIVTEPADSINQRRMAAPPRGKNVRNRMRTGALSAVSLALVGVVYVFMHGSAAQGAPIVGFAHPTARPMQRSVRLRKVKFETTNIAARDLFDRGRDPHLLRSDSGQRSAVDYLRQAVALDPNYAVAYALLASRYTTLAWAQPLPISERATILARAEGAARRAISLDDSLAEGHTALGYVLGVSHNESASLAELERAAAFDSSGSDTQEMLATAYEWVGRPEDAVMAARRAIRADPLSPTANAELGRALYFGHRYDEALAQLSKVARLDPPLRRVARYVAEVYCATGRWSEAISVLRPVAPHEPLLRGLLGYSLAQSGQTAEAKQLLTQMLADESAGLVPAQAISEVYAGLGDYERAFVWLNRSFDDYSLGPEIMGPLFEDLRADPRFEQIRRRLQIPPY